MAKIFRMGVIGGGTGGHIYPLIAASDAIKKQCSQIGLETEVRYFGNPGSYSFQLEKSGIELVNIASSKLRRYFSILNFLDFFKFFFGIFQALFKLFWFMPDVIFSKGGPGALSIIYAARFYKIPIVIHESDAIPGITSTVSAKHADQIELTFESAGQYFSGGKPMHVTGTPVRESLFITESRANARLSLGLLDERPTLLIVGGSQGAQIINEFVLENSELLLSRFEIIHQVGRENFVEYKAEYDFMSKNYPLDLRKNYLPLPYLDDRKMALALTAADVIVSRAGAGAIAEIAAFGKPTILIPLPTAANNHQRENAYAYAKAGAAIVIEEENLLPNLFASQVEKILADKSIGERMKRASLQFFKANAAELIAKDLIDASHVLSYYPVEIAS